jgi:signal transduction histidine kinase
VFALVGIVCVAALSGGMAFALIGWLSKTDERIASMYLNEALLVEHARSAHEEESASARAFLLTGSDSSLRRSRASGAIFEADLAQLRGAATSVDEAALVEVARARNAVYEESVQHVIALRHANAQLAEIRTEFEVNVGPAKADLDSALLAASTLAQRQVDHAREEAADARSRVVAIVGAVAFLGFVLATTLAVFLRRAASTLIKDRRRLAESLSRVEQSNRDLDAFAGRVAHDLRNALSPILMGARCVRTFARSPEKLGPLCERIDRAGGRAVTLLDSLLAFSRAKQVSTEHPSASVAEGVSQVLEQVEPDAARADVHVHCSIVDANVRCPPGLLQVVVANVLGNAVKFTKGGAKRNILVSSQRVRGGCQLRIDDSGPGIPETARERIFEPFFRVPGTTEPGTGIGLATVRRILEAYGGRISVSSRDEQGSSFEVWLPLADAPATGDFLASASSATRGV